MSGAAGLAPVTMFGLVEAKVIEAMNEDRRLHTLQDPISKLSPEVLCRHIQYLVEESNWSGHGKEVDPGTTDTKVWHERL